MLALTNGIRQGNSNALDEVRYVCQSTQHVGSSNPLLRGLGPLWDFRVLSL